MKNQTTSLEFSHIPVMLNEITQISTPSKGGLFVDCTFGGGGYSKALLSFSKTTVYGFDRDKAVVSIAKKLEKKFKKRFKFYQSRFSEIDKFLKRNVDTIIFDLGLSSIQLKDFKRGFSFHSKGKLDMNMGFSETSAQDVVNNLSEVQLKLIIKVFGEEKDAAKIAKNIVKARSEKKITKADELVKIIEKSKKKIFNSRVNPSTKTFQALRIFVNKEISELINGITNATKLLKPGGKILIVSFHSIEDKIVKYFFSNFSRNKSKPSRYLPDISKDHLNLFENYNKKVFKPSSNEIFYNRSSRSAKLRYAIRSNDKFVYPEDLFKKFYKYLNVEEINV